MSHYLHSLLAGLVTFLFVTGSLNAARYVTIATIGNVPSVERNLQPEKMVDQVIAFWRNELNQVLPDKPDLILLPEFCDLSGAGEEYLNARKDRVLDFFASVARDHRCYIVFGTKRMNPEGIWRNSCIILDRGGMIAGIYDKNFPTIGEMEQGIKASDEAPVFKCDFGRVGIAICFDLNFDELRLKYAAQKPDMILFSSMYHGGFVQSLWAYSCRSFFVGSVYRSTPSEILNPLGEVIASNTNYFDYAVAKINLDNEIVHLDYNWDKLKELKNKYGIGVNIHDPGKLGVVLVTSNNEKVTVQEMIDEFRLERVDDYFQRARKFRLNVGNLR
ncbi:MAG TPA: carbon-nitrogen hydrolase family protein [Bacteroidales bacterium]|nr:carbon-nitrogen hydrolase family protein [Bacteroidales bacterium]HNR40670.1 carbon-nitrogen hydrolase family protein [Bacteroidales bacterium]HPM18758.1 carbon-nitrogen hydrolase family protein [Bacteroidales bacterium]